MILLNRLVTYLKLYKGERLSMMKLQDQENGRKNVEGLRDQMVRDLNLNEKGLVTKGEFVSLYEDIGMGISSDQQFVEMLQSTWGVSEDDSLSITKDEIRSIVKTLRQRLIQKSSCPTEEYLLRKLFKEYDINNSGFLTLDELHSMFIKLEIPVQKRYLNAIFQIFDKNRSGTIEFEEFTSYIINDPFS